MNPKESRWERPDSPATPGKSKRSPSVVLEQLVVTVRVPGGTSTRAIARLRQTLASAAFRRAMARAIRAALGIAVPAEVRIVVSR